MNHIRKHRPWRVKPIAVPAFLLCAILAVFSLIPCQAATLDLQPGWNQITATSNFSVNSLPPNIDIFTLAHGAYVPVQAADMVAGRGYWVFSPLAVSLDIANHGASEDMVAVPLSQGWNLVGNPYAEAVFSTQHITVITSGVTALFHGSDCMEPVFYAFNPADNTYSAIPDTGALEPFHGYLVRAKTDCTLIISKPDSTQNNNPVTPVLRQPTVRPFQNVHIAPDPETGLDIASRELVIAAPSGMTIEDLGNRVRASGGTVAGEIPAAGMLQVVAPDGITPADFSTQLDLDASANFIFESAAPDDPVFSDSDPDNDYQFTSMNAAAVLGNAAVIPWSQTPAIAILDTGIDASHVEFTGRILPGYNFIASNENTTDDNGHGTQVTGAAAAAVGNSNGSTGLCGQCDILPVKVLDAQGRTTAFAVLAGIYYAADQGADVINISISGPNDHGMWERKFSEAAAYARAKGAIVVVAAGNNNADATDYLPGSAAGMFTVGAVTASDERAPFSNYGNALHVSAPGVQLYTTDRGGYTWFSGTSAAAPLAAGAAGFLKLHNPDWTPEQVEYALITTARPVATDYTLGAGIIDLAEALASSPSGGISSGGGGTGPGAGGGTGPGMGAASICTVTHNGDSGFNSLRWCIAFANTNGGADTIQFSISNTRIDLLSALPALTDPAGVTIDGSGLKIVISGHNLVNQPGLLITTPFNTIKDLSLIRFRADAANPYTAAGIRITGNDAHDNQIIGCRLGTDYQDNSGLDNANGIILGSLAHNNVITSTTGNQTVISGNYHVSAGHGIYIDGAKNNTIVKSIIGAKSNGTDLLENFGSGIYITNDGADDNVIGGDTGVSLGNLISGNNQHGIYISDGDNTLIYGNFIGVDNTGNTVLANKMDGVRLENSAKSTRVGNHNNGFRNILAGNGWSGVHVEGSNTTVNIILNNYIGVGLDGVTQAQNKKAGVTLRNSQSTYVGVDHLDVGSGNVISGNGTYGVMLYGSDTQNNLIQYNKIGVDILGNPMGNTQGGILIISNAKNNKIGAKEYNKDGDNIIAHNGRHGIEVRNNGSIWNKFFKNKFYENANLAIDLNNDGVTDNSVAAPGPNDYLDYPVITQIQSAGGSCYNISGTKAPNTYAHIYYASKPSSGINPDTSGHGEGYEYINMSPSPLAASTFSYNGICFAQCAAITAIAHDANGNTSEFSHWYDLCSAPAITNVLFAPATVIANGLQKTRVTATVTYVNGMQFMNTLTANLTLVGGSAALPMYDDGAHGDGAAGDGVYGSDKFAVAEGTAAGAKSIPLTATDVIGKSGSAAGTLTVQTLALPQPCGSDWPMFSCNAANSGQSSQLFKWPLSVKWTNDTAFNTAIYTSPAIYGTHIYVGENDGHAYAINKSDGSVAWSYSTGDSFLDNAPAVWNDSVFFASKNGKVYSFNRLTGSLNWIFDTGGGIRGSSPVVANDILYFGSENGTFYAINPSTKAVVWTFSPGFGLDYSFGDAPATVVNGVVFAGNADCSIYALDAFTGEKYWERQLTTANCQIAGGGTVVSGNFVCTATWDDDRAYCLNKFTGAIEWQQYNANAFVDSNGAVYNDLFILGTGDGTLVAYDIDNGGALRWEVSLDNELAHSSPVVFKDYLYVIDGGWITDDGVLYALDPNNNGQEVWRYNVGSFLVSNPAISDNLLVLGTTNTTNPALLAFEPGSMYNCPGWTVTTNAPNGSGSLYDCVMLANQTLGDNTITFTISNTIIQPVDPIPFTSGGGAVTVDGTGKNIVVDGTNCTLCSGFEITADNSMLKGIAVVQYKKDGRHAIDIQADNVIVDSCRVGTNFSDSTVIGNSSGIYIAGEDNKVTNSVISGNAKVGITIDGTDTTRTIIQNNKIGTKSTGLAALKNGSGGVLVTGGAHANTIGGSISSGLGNVISGNSPGYGIRIISANTNNNQIQGNIIGLGSDGSTTLQNNGAVQIFTGPFGTLVGGPGSDLGNFISGNYGTAINLSSAPGTTIQNNIIGLTVDKSSTRPNTEYGIALYDSNDTTIGNSGLKGNTISGNGLSGIYANSTSGLVIHNNQIGTKAGGTAAGNTQAGIQLLSSVSNVSIGGTNTYEYNVIAFNVGHGIDVAGSPSGVSIRQNWIHSNGGKGIQTGHDYNLSIDTMVKNGSNYDVTGSSSCSNCAVDIFEVDNTSTGISADPSGAGEGPVYIVSATTNASGAWSVTNMSVSANATLITATVTDTSDNTTEFAPNKTVPVSNCPGWKVTTTANSGMGSLRECLNEAVANGGNATITFDSSIAGGTITPQTELPAFVKPNITVDGGTNNITIDGGYPCPDCHGFVLRNSGGGVKNLTIVNFNTSNKSGIVIDGQLGKGDNYVITGNKIGTDGTTAKPNKYGVSLVLGADQNTIGGATAAERNIISGNTVFGINIIAAGSNYNNIYGNFIGFASDGTTAIPNQDNGIHIGNQASYNKIGGSTAGQANRIGKNTKRGIYVSANTCIRNLISRNIIYDNTLKGIELVSGANQGILPPTISTVTTTATDVYNISGTTAPACAGCTVELFRVDNTGTPTVGQDASGSGEAYAYIETAITNASGAWSFTGLTIIGGDYITATVTDTVSNTSAFAANKELPSTQCPGYVVKTNADSGFASLRECINEANTAGGNATITFDNSIANQTISPSSVLPRITVNNVTIDGGAQDITLSGASCLNCYGIYLDDCNNNKINNLTIVSFTSTGSTNGAGIFIVEGFGHVITGNKIGTDGSTAKSNNIGLLAMDTHHITVGGNTPAQRNIISGNRSNIYFSFVDDTTISGNYIGMDETGSAAILTSTMHNILIEAGRDIIIGGDDISERNIISGALYGIFVLAAMEDSQISGNYIGTNAAGTTAIPNSEYGILLEGTHTFHNIIGGSTPGHRNVISGNKTGIKLSTYAGSNSIINNYIGLDSTGYAPLPNTDFGIYLQSGHNTIGGTTSNERNIVTSNGTNIYIKAYSNKIIGNYIGTNKDANKITGLGASNGISIDITSHDNVIGGSLAGEANIIAYHSGYGIEVKDATAVKNKFSRNRIFENQGLGIDLQSGANEGVTPPSIDTVIYQGSNSFNISGTTSPACPNCTIELFRVDDTATSVGQDATGAGEGFEYLDTATTNALGQWSFSNKTITGGSYITATLTDTNANTSEFADNEQLTTSQCPGYVVTTTADTGFGSLRECINEANTAGGNATITFNASIAGSTIKPQTQLPSIDNPDITIDGGSNDITLDGSYPCTDCHGLVLRSNGGGVKNLTIVHFETNLDNTGILIDGQLGGGQNYVITGNKIGNDGTTVKLNWYGVKLIEGADHNTIGGTAAGDRNIISGNGTGIFMTGYFTTDNYVYNNYIGFAPDGVTALPNGTGIAIQDQASNNKIGGSAAGQPNLIGNNYDVGVAIDGINTRHNAITRNIIYNNGNKGIDLTNKANDYIPSAFFWSVTLTAPDTYNISGITGGLCVGCIVELFRVDDTATSVGQDASGAGEAYEYLGSTINGGSFAFTGITITGGQYITATVTSPNGNTSEFANNYKLPDSMCPGYVVTTNADTGFGSLRECINEANADSAASNITFHSSLSGQTITLASALPTLTDDATTIKNTTAGQITINGGNNTFGCFSIFSSDNEIRRLTIVKCGDVTGGHGIAIAGSSSTGNVIAGNYIGTSSTGSSGLGNRTGILVQNSASNNTIGGTTAADRNIISGNTIGVNLHFSATGNTIIGNYIGTNPAGTGKVANTAGVVISNGANTNTTGGTTAAYRNLISGNDIGILIQGAGSDGNSVIGNYIGSNSSGGKTAGIENKTAVKIELGAQDNTIGGAAAGQANLIVYSSVEGVLVKDAGTTGNTISRNKIYENFGRGIELTTGGNNGIAPPSISTVTSLGFNAYNISGTTSPACANCTIELFRVDDSATSVGQDATGAGEAFAYIDTATTNAAGVWSFTNKTINGGSYVTATLTDTSGNTSEFAANRLLNGAPVITSLTSTSQDISFYEMITLAATATDPDGDPLTYEWSGGSPNPFSATTTATTNWTAPKAAYWATMTVTVRDGKGGVATGTIAVRVGIKDISHIKVFPDSLDVRRNNSHTFKIQAHFITGDTFLVNAESAKVKNGLGTITPTGFFQAGNTLGTEQVTFTIGDFRQVIPVNIIP